MLSRATQFRVLATTFGVMRAISLRDELDSISARNHDPPMSTRTAWSVAPALNAPRAATTRHRWWIASILFINLVTAHAEAPNPDLHITKTRGEIEIDGDLSDSGWVGAAAVEEFFETQPGDNSTPKARTRAWLTFDDEALYVAFDCDDPEPAKIRAPFSDRDRVDHYQQDLVQVMLDTRGDRRAAYRLSVNPRGVQNDGIFTEATQTEDTGPDFHYDAATRIDGHGWFAEMRIPFSSLHYASAEAPVWGVVLGREYPREFPFDFESNPVPRGSACLICHMRRLVGLRDLPSGSHWVVAPFATASRLTERARPGDLGSPLRNSSIDTNVGVDIKWSPASDHTLDLALNPDFSQVESDVPQLAVNNRFALFYPEKRPLFLESVDLFATPLQAVSTRTITDPDWGARATGRVGNTAYTALFARDAGGGSVVLPGAQSSDLAPQNSSSTVVIGRARRAFGDSFGGLLISTRELSGGGFNRVLGPDFQWRPNDAETVTGQLLLSDTLLPDRTDLAAEWDGSRLRSSATSLEWLHLTRRFVSDTQVTVIGAGFRDDNGFIPQVGFRHASWVVGPNFYPSGAITWLHPYVTSEVSQTTEGQRLGRTVSPGVNINGPLAMSLDVRYHIADQLLSGDRLFDLKFGELELNMSPSRRFDRLGLQLRLGDDVDFTDNRLGHGGDIKVSATVRPIDRLELIVDGERQWLDVDRTERSRARLFTASVARVKATIHFSPRAYLRLLSERIRADRDVSLYDGCGLPQEPPLRECPSPREQSRLDSALFSYKLNWQTLAYVGYQSNRLLSPSGSMEVNDKQIFLKLAYAWRR